MVSNFLALIRNPDLGIKRFLKEGITTLSLIGYTNAGKFTLLKALTDANVLIQDKLVSTLDPTVKNYFCMME